MLAGGTEWLLVAGIAVLVFGASPFVKAARGLGEGVAQFKKAASPGEERPQSQEEEPSPPPPAQAP